jgi:hypothetical protein
MSLQVSPLSRWAGISVPQCLQAMHMSMSTLGCGHAYICASYYDVKPTIKHRRQKLQHRIKIVGHAPLNGEADIHGEEEAN